MKTGRISKIFLSLSMAFATILLFNAVSANAESGGGIEPSACSTFISAVFDEAVEVGGVGQAKFYCGAVSDGIPIDFPLTIFTLHPLIPRLTFMPIRTITRCTTKAFIRDG
ncbi:hypothetical protein HMSSN036_55370 [Paenibacillus macerans]|nr:hypothetical protein HMSSN036_55370 [Paenibacillus macerans]